MSNNLEELKRLAEAATPGPWDVAVWTCGVRGCEVKRGIDRIGCDLHFPNAEFIAAANPAAILELIRQRDELLVALKDAHQVLRDWGAYIPSSTIQEDLEMLGVAIANAEKQ